MTTIQFNGSTFFTNKTGEEKTITLSRNRAKGYLVSITNKEGNKQQFRVVQNSDKWTVKQAVNKQEIKRTKVGPISAQWSLLPFEQKKPARLTA